MLELLDAIVIVIIDLLVASTSPVKYWSGSFNRRKPIGHAKYGYRATAQTRAQ